MTLPVLALPLLVVSGGSNSPYDDVRALLPTLAQPGWVKWIGNPIVPLLSVVVPVDPVVDPVAHKKALQKADRKASKASRHARFLKGLQMQRIRNTRSTPPLLT